MRRERQKRTRIILALMGVLLLMSVGYAAFNTNLNITGTSNISNSWDIEITNISDPVITGSAKHVAKEIGTNKLSASMEADLYDEGDSAEYTVTIQNKGSVDAVLDSITKDTEKANENIDITFTNYAKGQRLESGKTIDIKVKIAYPTSTALNSNTNNSKIKLMSTDNTLASSEIKITFNFKQAEGYKDSEDYPIPDTYLVEYDCTTNGGKDCSEFNEYLKEGESVNLTNIGYKKGYFFLGWAEEANAENPIESKTIEQDNVKLYALYKEDKITFESVNTTSSTNSITVVAKATSLSEIIKYEYSIDNENYFEGTIDKENNNSTYTFEELEQDKTYPIYVKATTKSGISETYEVKGGVDLTENVVTEGDGLYADSVESGRYIYRGANPSNYICLGDLDSNGKCPDNSLYRIISTESDGTLKVIKNISIGNIAYDNEYSRSSKYCNNARYGCNVWGSSGTMYKNESPITAMPRKHNETDAYELPSDVATLNTSLNSSGYYNDLSTKIKGLIKEHYFNNGPLGWVSGQTLATDISQEAAYKWKGKVGLMNATDFVRASTISSCTNVYVSMLDPYPCKYSNWLFGNQGNGSHTNEWTLSPYSNPTSEYVCIVTSSGQVGFLSAYNYTYAVRPVLYLSSDIALKGEGTTEKPYYIGNAGADTKQLETPTFTEEETDNGKRITIDYHKECGSNGIECTYIKNGETIENLTGSRQTVEYTKDGTLVATISDGTNTVRNPVSSSYTIEIPLTAISGTGVEIMSSFSKNNTLGLITDDYGNIRYSGLNVNNYVCMANETTCSDANLYRIIGVFKDIKTRVSGTGETRIKLIKATPHTYDNWNTTLNNNWARPATLNTTLQSLSIASNSYVSNAVWNIGGHNTSAVTPKDMYNYERGTTGGGASPSTTTWIGKVALMYPSDYGYASSSCYSSKTLNQYDDSTCKYSNWLFPLDSAITRNSYEWLLTPNSSASGYAFYVLSAGSVSCNANNTNAVRPTVYLKSDVSLVTDDGRDGSENKPYLLK